jgi:hypothetical protein
VCVESARLYHLKGSDSGCVERDAVQVSVLNSLGASERLHHPVKVVGPRPSHASHTKRLRGGVRDYSEKILSDVDTRDSRVRGGRNCEGRAAQPKRGMSVTAPL